MPAPPHVLVLNGPNLNLLGVREPHLYGAETLDDVEARLRALMPEGGRLTMRQSNWEGRIVDWVQAAREGAEAADAIVVNPGALTHTSIALLDALNAYEGPVIEVHVSQIHRREAFRHRSYVSLRADGVVAGFGVEGYEAALRRALTLLEVRAAAG
jgi:3-dehydroquinate dehydratase-2